MCHNGLSSSMDYSNRMTGLYGISISIHAPLAGSDPGILAQRCGRRDFNPRSPRGERRTPRKSCRTPPAISIHAPLAGSDGQSRVIVPETMIFQSTLPSRGATAASAPDHEPIQDFNPRSPRGERRPVSRISVDSGQFQSTLPSRGATPLFQLDIAPDQFQSTLPSRGATSEPGAMRSGPKISIHAPLAGSDVDDIDNHPFRLISIHAPLAGSDSNSDSEQ